MHLKVLAFVLFDIALGNPALSQNSTEFWDESEAFGQTNTPSQNLRLPSDIIPSFYRLKLKTDLNASTFTGEVYITIRATKPAKKIVLHAKDLKVLHYYARLTEQIYEKVDVLHSKVKREAAESNSTEPTPKDATNTSEIITNTNTTPEVKKETTTPINNATTPLEVNSSDTTVIPTVIPTELTNATEVTEEPKHPLETQVTHSSVKDIKILSINQGAGDRLILSLANTLKVGVDYTLELSFEGTIANALTGFYKSTYQNEKKESSSLAVTQFEPTSARAAFPCFDEPEFKAKFEISIAHHKNLTALSNMKVASVEDIPEQPSYVWTHFERSVNMSTYLVAYILSDFKSLETTYTSKDNVTKTIRVWARPELIHKAKYALEITPKLLSYYEEVFGVPYALDKLDLVAIPDFSSGAMENWGLMTFRETALLFDETESVPRDKQNVAIDVAHELAHQWFGNLVTMRWWTDLWLNEGFATYIEYVGVDKIEPEWNMFESFTQDKMDLLRSDALKNTSPVSRKVVDASEISQKFDEISYMKGANLIRMLNNTITGELFHKGLAIYLNEWKFSNAEENDLWLAMSVASKPEPRFKDLSVVEFMNSWTRQAGYPVVRVIRNYTNGVVTFKQNLFSTAKQPYKQMEEQLWHIPLTYTTLTNASESETEHHSAWLKERSISVPTNMSDKDALYVNVDAIGYYRVNYDAQNWALLRDALKSGRLASPIAKAQLIDDTFNLAKVSQLNYTYALDLITFVKNGESSKMVWDLLLNNLGFLKYCLKATPAYVPFQDYVKTLISKQLASLNYGLDKPKDDQEAFLIENLLMWECIVESPRCLSWANRLFDQWTTQPDINNNPIPRYLRSLVYSVVLRHGGRRQFEFLWSLFRNSTDPSVRSLVVTNLPSTSEASLIAMLLEKSLSEIPQQYAVAVWAVDSIVGSKVAQDFLINNWDRVYSKFTQMDPFMFPGVLSGAFGAITTKEDLDKLKRFALQHKEELRPMSQTLQKLVDAANFRIEWLAKHVPDIETWLRDYLSSTPASSGGNSTETVTAAASTETPSTTVLPDASKSPVDNATSTSNSSVTTTPASA